MNILVLDIKGQEGYEIVETEKFRPGMASEFIKLVSEVKGAKREQV
jgi:hypothetical protein